MFLNLRPLLEDIMCTKKLSALQLYCEYLRGKGGGGLLESGGLIKNFRLKVGDYSRMAY